MYGSGHSFRLAAISAAVLLAVSSGASAAGVEHKHVEGKTTLVLDQGKKWQTDVVARQGMDNVRNALAADLKAIHAGKQTTAQYQALAARVNAEVANMVKNCRLDPKADAQFHQVIAELMAGAESMEGKDTATSPRRGAERAARAVNDYGRHFAHPGWKRL